MFFMPHNPVGSLTVSVLDLRLHTDVGRKLPDVPFEVKSSTLVGIW